MVSIYTMQPFDCLLLTLIAAAASTARKFVGRAPY